MDYYNIIFDEEEVRYFFDTILPPLEETDVYFVSLSARNKYLNQVEREVYKLGRTEMFQKILIKERAWGKFIRAIRRLECNKSGYTTSNGKSIPDKALVCYININASNTLKALEIFKDVLAKYEAEVFAVALKGRKNNNLGHNLNNLDNALLTAYQQSRGSKVWIDIDIDIPKEIKLYEHEGLKYFLENRGLKEYFWIDTKSGYHLLLKRKELFFDPRSIIKYIFDVPLTQYYMEKTGDPKELCSVLAYKHEVVENKNEMIPMPGTLQALYPVKILNRKA